MDYSSLISIDNLFQAWEEFKKGKRKKHDVMVFERNLEDNLFSINSQLKNKTYKHGAYQDFYVNDPKRRHIHKAEVKDRVVHHLLYKYLYEIFDKTFIYDSYSCRLNKGTHRSVRRLEKYARIVSRNYTQECWALKLDIKQFFASVDHDTLMGLIARRVKDKDILSLLNEILSSFGAKGNQGVGIPLGNLTSQIFANLYLNELDKFIKHKLKIKYYFRYADDFIILDSSKKDYCNYTSIIAQFLGDKLKLELHPNKIFLRKLSSGIDFCGYIVLPHYILPRTKTKRRIINKINGINVSIQSLQSYLGYFSHASSYNLKRQLINDYYLNNETS